MDKVIKDGKVAVLVSGGWGAGWYSWNENVEQCLFDPQIVNLVLQETGEDEELHEDAVKRIEKIASEKWRKFYGGGASGLYVEWVTQGEQFEIREYDGNESIHVIGKSEYITA